MNDEPFNPHDYAIAKGWDYSQIEATARNGVSEEDAKNLDEGACCDLYVWCLNRVEEQSR